MILLPEDSRVASDRELKGIHLEFMKSTLYLSLLQCSVKTKQSIALTTA